MQIFLSIIIFIAGLAIVICLHEAGHFSMAKLFDVFCEEFSIGFGPKIISINPKDKVTGKKKWETTLNIRLLPLGGYVAMVGEEDSDGMMTEAGEAPVPKERTFGGVAHWKQAIIMIAGIVMNVILSYFLFLVGNAFGVQQDPYSDRIGIVSGGVLDDAELGISDGDVISRMKLSIGESVYESDGSLNPDRTLKIVDGTGKELSESQYAELYQTGIFDDDYFKAAVDSVDPEGYIDWTSYPYNPNSVNRYIGDRTYLGGYNFYSMQQALDIGIYDLRQNDDGVWSRVNVYLTDDGHISSYDLGAPVQTSRILQYAPIDPEKDAEGQYVSANKMTATFDYIPDGAAEGETKEAVCEIPAVVSIVDSADGSGETQQVAGFGSIGITVHMDYMPDPDTGRVGSETITAESFGQAIVQSFVDQGESIASVYVALGSLFTKEGWQNVGGIVSIFMVNSQAVDLGFYYVMYVWGLISVNLAVMNLLPIPGLDGWQLVLCIIDSILKKLGKKSISNKFKSIASVVGLSCLLVLAAVLVILDCIRYFA